MHDAPLGEQPHVAEADGIDRLAWWCRSLTVTPGPDLARLYKAQRSGADVVLYDLEDGVYPALRAEARHAFLTLDPVRLRCPLGLRVNGPRTEDCALDMKMLAAAPAQPFLVVVPKIETPEDIRIADEFLIRAGSRAWIWALVESGAGVINASEIARASSRLAALTFGAADFCAELGITMKWESLLYARSQVVLAARTAGLGALDAPTFALDDPGLLAAESRAAADLGFTGKIAIHPNQVEVINSAFTPGPDQVEWATSVVAAMVGRAGSIARVGSQMVGPPFVRTAERILAQARQAES